jgi:restriction endonuclease Mrr
MLQILIIAFGAIGVGFALIFLLALADKRARKRNPAVEEPGLTQRDFERACVEIVERMKLSIDEIVRTEDDNLDIRATHHAPVVGGEFFVRCVYLEPGGVIPAAEVLELSSAIVQDRLSKGIFFTNGSFAADIPSLSELAPMEFIDGARLKTMMADLPMV